MSRKNYVQFATMFANQIAYATGGPTGVRARQTAQIARKAADIFKADNPNFRYDTFFEACGLDDFGHIKEN